MFLRKIFVVEIECVCVYALPANIVSGVEVVGERQRVCDVPLRTILLLQHRIFRYYEGTSRSLHCIHTCTSICVDGLQVVCAATVTNHLTKRGPHVITHTGAG